MWQRLDGSGTSPPPCSAQPHLGAALTIAYWRYVDHRGCALCDEEYAAGCYCINSQFGRLQLVVKQIHELTTDQQPHVKVAATAMKVCPTAMAEALLVRKLLQVFLYSTSSAAVAFCQHAVLTILNRKRAGWGKRWKGAGGGGLTSSGDDPECVQ